MDHLRSRVQLFTNSITFTIFYILHSLHSSVSLAFRRKKPKSILSQISTQVVKLRPADLRLPARAWKVKLVGEGADDAGGVFDDTITEMCQELQTGVSQLLIPTPNSLNDIGYNRDRSVDTCPLP